MLLSALPERPAEFAAMEPAFAPRPRTRKMIGMMSVILAGILLIMLGYLAVGVSGYLAFPTTVSSNALNNFASGDVLMQVWPPPSAPCAAKTRGSATRLTCRSPKA